jgi:hypothetical protein
MSGLAALLAGRRPAGLYVWDSAMRPADVAHAAELARFRAFLLDGRAATDEESFLTVCEGALSLPARTWEGLADCLTDLSWAPAKGYVVVYDGWGMLARCDPQAWATAYDILASAARGWAREGTPFAVLFRGPGPGLGLPRLDAVVHRPTDRGRA